MKREYIRLIIIIILIIIAILISYVIITSMAPSGWGPGLNIFEVIIEIFQILGIAHTII